MIKRILVALDPDEDTPVATRYAIALAKKFDASLTGLAVVDTSNIYTDVGGGEIDTHYARNLWEELSEESRKVASGLLDKFKKTVEKEGVRYSAVKKEGASYDRIIEGMKYHDLLIVGRDSHFFYNEPERDTRTLAKVVKDGVAPTLVVTNSYREINSVLVAFDGSAAAARSLKSFVHLMPYGTDINMELLYVPPADSSEERQKAKDILTLTRNYLEEHGFNKIAHKILQEGTPSSRILERQQQMQPDLTILGAHSVSAIRRIAFGSTTHDLITRTSVPLFLTP